MKKNYYLYYAQTAIYNFLYLVAAGTVFQTFMLECGIDEARASFAVSAFQIIQTATMFLLSGPLERVKNIIGGVSLYMASYLVPFFSMIFIAVFLGVPIDSRYGILFASGAIFAFSHGCYSILIYKMPHHIMSIKDYGKAFGQAGAISGVLGIAMSTLLSFLLSKFEYFTTMIVVLTVCCVLALVAAFIGLAFYRIPLEKTVISKAKINLFKYKPFYMMLFPNFARGVSSGIINLIAIVGYYENIIDSTSAALMVTVSQAATLIGCQSFSAVASKHKNGLLCLLSSIGLIAFMPMMLLGKNHVFFLAFYFVVFVFNTYISYAAPVIITEHIDYNCLGQYTAWRVGLTYLGTSVGNILVPILLDLVGALGTLLFGGIIMLPFGIGYYIFEKRSARK